MAKSTPGSSDVAATHSCGNPGHTLQLSSQVQFREKRAKSKPDSMPKQTHAYQPSYFDGAQ